MSSRTALVTGATGLLGREIAAVFRQNGWTVKGTGFSRADGIDVLKVDLGSEADVAKVFDEVK
jgi:NAD(P)-dependent dehydrogenase (short-subunit alcohol dehydrogenase family)